MIDTNNLTKPVQPFGKPPVAVCSKGVELRALRAIREHRFARKSLQGRSFLLLFLALACLFPGCTVCHYARQTVRKDPAEFNWKADRKRSLKTYRSWANREWCRECAADPGLPMPSDYVAGFKDGFVDYVYAGGSGQPPPVPPRRFWNVGARNSHGHEAAANWFAGYQHGASVARNEGYRERTTIQASSLLFAPAEVCLADQPFGADSGLVLPVEPLQPELVVPELIDTAPSYDLPSATPPIINEELPSLEPLELKKPFKLEGQEPVEPTNNKLPKTQEEPAPEFEDLFETRGSDSRGASSKRRSAKALSKTTAKRANIPRKIVANGSKSSKKPDLKRHPSRVKNKTIAQRDHFIQRTSLTIDAAPQEVTPQCRPAPRQHVSEQSKLRGMWDSLPQSETKRRPRDANAAKPTHSARSQTYGRHIQPTKATERSAIIPRSEDHAEEMFHRLTKAAIDSTNRPRRQSISKNTTP